MVGDPTLPLSTATGHLEAAVEPRYSADMVDGAPLPLPATVGKLGIEDVAQCGSVRPRVAGNAEGVSAWSVGIAPVLL